MKQIVCFGDSNTFGLIPATTDRYQWGIRWTSILSEKLEKYSWRIIEDGLCGRTTIFDDPKREGRRSSQSLPITMEIYRPIDVIILMLGTNDCKRAYKASSDLIGRGIEKLIEIIKEASPKCQILLVSPIHLGERVWQESFDWAFSPESVEISKALSSEYRSIANKWDIAYLEASKYATSSEVDQQHLDEEGHQKLAEAIYNALRTELSIV